MRLLCLRLTTAGTLFAGILAIVLSGGSLVNGQIKRAVPPGNGKDGKADKKDDRSPEDENLPFAFPYERDAKERLKAARDYLNFKEVPWNKVCPFLQEILESKSDSFFDVPYIAGNKRKVNRISVKTEANHIISAFNAEGLQFYQQTYGQTASALLNDAINANYDIPTLASVSQKYFHTKAGAEATILLGTIYLERGNYLEAAYTLERLLARPAVEEFLTPRTLFKLCLALKRSGDPRHADLLKSAIENLRRATARDGLALGRKTYSFEQLKEEIDRPIPLLRANTMVGEWSMRGGTPARSGTVNGGAPFLAPTFRGTMFPVKNVKDGDSDGYAWITNELEKLFSRDARTKSLPLPAFFPVTAKDMVIYRTYKGIVATATRDHIVNGRVIRAGDLLWSSDDTVGIHHLISRNSNAIDANMRQRVNEWWQSYYQTGVTSVLFENPLLGTLSQDGQNLYYIDDIAIPPAPTTPMPGMGMQMQEPAQTGTLKAAISAGRLVALKLRSGSIAWWLGRVEAADTAESAPAPTIPSPLNEDEADRSTSAFQICLDAVFLGAPLPLNGKIYVLIEQAGVIRLLCLDPHNLVAVPGFTPVPALVWSQKLGRPNNALPQESIRRFQGANLAESEGIMICPTNSGAVVAIDLMSHSLLWAHAYRELEASDRQGPAHQQMIIGPGGRYVQQPTQQLPTDRWRASQPIIAGGRVIVTAYDSNKLECLDLRTGKVIWSLPRAPSDLYIGGIVHEKVIVIGKTQVRAYDLFGEDDEQKPRLAFEISSMPTPTGHGMAARGLYFLPVRPENAGTSSNPAAEIWAINVETGQIVSKTAARKRNDNNELEKYGLGNLVFHDGQVFAQSAWEMSCYPQLDLKRAEMDRLLAANPRDPIGLLNRGELLLDDGKITEAIADFNEAEKHQLPEEKVLFLKEKKYYAYTELLRNDFPAAEKYLDEYARLCEIPADASEAPEDKIRREDEIGRRQRWREFLLAKGRENQGRLGEAFDHYIALANMGEAKNLVEMPDQPNVRMRPDVWARGQIENMIRAIKDPAARQSLDSRVEKEWHTVQNGNDLKRLQDFVAIFGPYFRSGAEAQFLLANKLLETHNENDFREAQTYLSQLRVTGESYTIRARATEALARLMVRNQMMEDAVGLYLQLGKEYPNVIVRDGKTGAQFMTELLTDKRLLPYLEPSRYPLPSRMKAEPREAVPGGLFNMQFDVEPRGELFPMYRRYRFVMDAASQNNVWTLRAYDRASAVERCKFPGLAPPQMFNQGMPLSSPTCHIQANGQLLLAQIGSMMYCLDLTERKECWHRNLLGDDIPPGIATGQRIMSPDADGDIVAVYEEGYIITLGRAAVLQAGYAALLTRDGLEVVEPLTRKVLWTRKGIAPRTQLYGDSRHLLLVKMDASKKPIGTRLLRAVDGIEVPGSVDIGRMLESVKHYQFFGSTVLLLEAAADKPRILRLVDLTDGHDVWKREYSPQSVPIKSLSPEWCGCIKPNGEAEVVEVKSGKLIARLQIDPATLATEFPKCVQGQLLADTERFYLFLDRPIDGAMRQPGQRFPLPTSALRTLAVNGPLLAFDRTTGQRLWNYGDGLGLFDNQQLVLEQFADLPVMILTGVATAQNRQMAPVIVIEKERGRLLMNKPIQNNGNVFQNLTVNMKNSTIELNRMDMRIVIAADENPKSEGP